MMDFVVLEAYLYSSGLRLSLQLFTASDTLSNLKDTLLTSDFKQPISTEFVS